MTGAAGQVAEEAVPEPLMTSGEVAALFGVGPHTVTYWGQKGRLTVADRTPGGHRRYQRAEAEPLAQAWRACREWPATATIAAALRVSQDTVSRWARNGRLPDAVQGIDGQWRVPPAILQAMVAGKGE